MPQWFRRLNAISMRSDFVGKCLEQDYGGLADKVQENLVSIRSMTTEELAQAITGFHL